MTTVYRTESEIEEVVKGLELCTTAKDLFPHSSHLTVAVWYLRNAEFPVATEKMRNALRRFLRHHGVNEEKYNETLTMFWLRMVEQALREAEDSVVGSTNAILESLGNSSLVLEYYSKERLWSEEARLAWLGPDLKALPE
ncbi:MAG TPA: hypothetical protein VJ124_17080 [Pyrinomonadaceae bacterium]|nr:hypothetical protein [Pyrinomonadaceae bacterium]